MDLKNAPGIGAEGIRTDHAAIRPGFADVCAVAAVSGGGLDSRAGESSLVAD